jgi:hypothetical protein
MAVMQQLSHIVSAVAYDLKPVARDFPQFIGMLIHPNLDGRIPLDRIGKTQQLIHRRTLRSGTTKVEHPASKLKRRIAGAMSDGAQLWSAPTAPSRVRRLR